MTKVFPEQVVFNISQLKFTAFGEAGKPLFNFGLLKNKNKITIESLPPGVLPDKMVFNIRELTSDIEKLIVVLKTYKNKFDLSEFTDLGNDIDYAIKELPKFRSRLRLMIQDAAAKMTKDIFDNVYAGFGKYKYIELLFSQDYKNIISVRLLGSSRRRAPKRFVIFNIPNENLDINIVNLVYKSKNIIKEYANYAEQSVSAVGVKVSVPVMTVEENTSGYEFLAQNFVPVPPVHKKPSFLPGHLGSGAAFLENLVKDVSPKTYDTLIESNKNLSLLSTRQQVNQISQGLSVIRSFEDSSLLSSVRDRDKIKNIKDGFTNPIDCILFLWNNVFSNFLSCEFIQQAVKSIVSLGFSQTNLDEQLFRNISLIQLFEGIDRLPVFIRQLIYLNFNNDLIGLNIENGLTAVQNYISSLPKPTRLLNCKDASSILEKYYSDLQTSNNSSGLSSIFKQLKEDYPNNFSDIQRVFDENFSRDAIAFIVRSFADLLMAIDYCNFNLDFSLPTVKIADLWLDLSINIEDIILGIICELLSNIFELFINMLTNLGRFQEFFSKFMNDEDIDLWTQYVDYAFYLLITSSNASTRTQSISNAADVVPFKTEEGQSFARTKVASTLSPNPIDIDSRSNGSINNNGFSAQQQNSNRTNSTDFCDDVLSTSGILNVSGDINYQIPSTIPGFSSRDGIEQATLEQLDDLSIAALAGISGRPVVRRQKTTTEVLDKIKFFTYCKKQDFFSTSNVVDPSVVDVLRQISKSVPPLFPNSMAQNSQTPKNKDEMSESLKNMFRQIQSVLSKAELADLINNNYTEEVASVVRIIAKINFPTITNNVDPIKYFTMLGKVIGRTIEELKKSGAIR